MLFVESLLRQQSGESEVSAIGTTALIWLSGDTIAGLPDGTEVSTWTNLGQGGASYNASASTNPCKKVTFGGMPAIDFAASGIGFDLVTPVTLTGGNATLVLVTKQSATRVVALGRKAGGCFWGSTTNNNGSFYLYRDTADTGWSPSTLVSVAGYKVFCIQVIGTTSITYFDNSVTPASVSAPLGGTFLFDVVGYRGAQTSRGYAAEIMVFTSVIPVSTCQTLVSALKVKYNV